MAEVYQSSRTAGRPIPQTMTQLYTELTLTRLERYRKENNQTWSLPDQLEDLPQEVHDQFLALAQLAYEGIVDQEVIFDKLPSNCSHLGLMTVSQELYTRKRGVCRYNFFHLTLQEFLAAFHISQLPDSEQKTCFKRKLSHMDLVWRFVAGLTGFKQVGWEMLWNSCSVGNLFVQCLYEAQEKVDCELVLERSEVCYDHEDRNFSAFACYALGYCIARSGCTWVIKLGCSALGVEMLAYGLTSQKYITGAIVTLDFSLCPIELAGMAFLKEVPQEILEQICNLNVSHFDNELNDSSLELLSNVIPTMTSLKSLDISSLGLTFIDTAAITKLLQALETSCHLAELNMYSLYIDSIEVDLSKLITPGRSLEHLKIYMVDIDTALEEVLFSPSSLVDLTVQVAENLSDTSLLADNCNLTSLVLTYDGSCDGLSSVAEALCTNNYLEELSLELSFHTDSDSENETWLENGILGLAEMLKVNATLNYLTVEVNGWCDILASIGALQILVDALQDNRSLECLELPKSWKDILSLAEHRAVDSRVEFS